MVEVVVVDVCDEFVEGYCLFIVLNNVLYMDCYLLVLVISWLLIVKYLVVVVCEYGGGIVVYGCIGKGND